MHPPQGTGLVTDEEAHEHHEDHIAGDAHAAIKENHALHPPFFNLISAADKWEATRARSSRLSLALVRILPYSPLSASLLCARTVPSAKGSLDLNVAVNCQIQHLSPIATSDCSLTGKVRC